MFPQYYQTREYCFKIAVLYSFLTTSLQPITSITSSQSLAVIMPIVLLVIGSNVAKMFLQWAIFVHCVYVYTNMGPLELKYLKSLAKSFAAKEERGLILSA